jgi:cytochrome c biogenesis protein CcdA
MFGKIKENIEGYIETRIELIKLETQEQLTKFISQIAKSLILFIIGAMVVFFLSVALAMGINQGFDSWYAGFLFMAGFYLLIFIIVYIYKDSKFVNDLISFKPKNTTKP